MKIFQDVSAAESDADCQAQADKIIGHDAVLAGMTLREEEASNLMSNASLGSIRPNHGLPMIDSPN